MDLPIKAFWSFIGFRWGCEEKACSGMWVSDGFVCVCGGVAQDTCLCCMFGPVSTHAHTLAAVPQIIRLFLTYMGYRRHGGGGHRSTVHCRLRSFAALYTSKCWVTLCSPYWLYLSPWTHEGWCRVEHTDCFTWSADQLISMWLSYFTYKSV